MTLPTLPLKLDLTHIPLSDAQFYQLCCNNPDLANRAIGESSAPQLYADSGEVLALRQYVGKGPSLYQWLR
ncbi:MAG: hypothetical protein WBA10_18305 [Elainellaceae cyanobacterium]